MNRRTLWILHIAFIFIFSIHFIKVEATSQFTNQETDYLHLNRENFFKLEKQGYKVQDIVKAAHISMYTNHSIESILRYYKDHPSWDKTAEHFGVDLKKMEAEEIRKTKKSQQEYKEKIIMMIAAYTNNSPNIISQYLKEAADLHFLLIAAAISKTTNTEFSQIIQYKKEDKNVDQIISMVHADRKKVFDEVHMLHSRIKQIK